MPSFVSPRRKFPTSRPSFIHEWLPLRFAIPIKSWTFWWAIRKAGQAYFNGAGKCIGCHSVTGDLKGIGAKYEPAKLQDKIVMPRDDPRKGPAVQVTVTLSSGERIAGDLVLMTDFDVTLRDANRIRHTYARNGDSPKVETKGPVASAYRFAHRV